MKYRESLVKYAREWGVLRASRKYNKSRSYIYFWMNRYDGRIDSLACRSRRPHHHPNEHNPAELKLIRAFRRANAEIGLLELWFKLRDRGYQRHYVSLYRVMEREGLNRKKKATKARYKPKPYEQMQYPGQRVQVDVKHVPAECLAHGNGRKFYQYTAIDEFSRLRYLEGFEEANTYSSTIFIQHAIRWFSQHGISIECVQTDIRVEFYTNMVLSSPSGWGKLKMNII